jgi:hypothetical protein
MLLQFWIGWFLAGLPLSTPPQDPHPPPPHTHNIFIRRSFRLGQAWAQIRGYTPAPRFWGGGVAYVTIPAPHFIVTENDFLFDG